MSFITNYGYNPPFDVFIEPTATLEAELDLMLANGNRIIGLRSGSYTLEAGWVPTTDFTLIGPGSHACTITVTADADAINTVGQGQDRIVMQGFTLDCTG